MVVVALILSLIANSRLDMEIGAHTKLSQLPKEVVKYVNPIYERDYTEILYIDLDRDGKDEMFLWNGNAGASFGGAFCWEIFRLDKNGKYQHLDSVSGRFAKVKVGRKNSIVLMTSCGWDKQDYEYYELKDNKMVNTFTIRYYLTENQKTKNREVYNVDIKFKKYYEQ